MHEDALPAQPRPSRSAELEAVKKRTAEQFQAIEPHVGFLAAIRRPLPRDGFFVEELCQAGFASSFAVPVHRPRTAVTLLPPGPPGLALNREHAQMGPRAAPAATCAVSRAEPGSRGGGRGR